MPAAKEEAKRPCPRARQCVGLRVRGAECASGKNSSPPMQTLQRKRCQTRARSRKKGCAYGARVSGATIFTYVGGNPLLFVDPEGLRSARPAAPGGNAYNRRQWRRHGPGSFERPTGEGNQSAWESGAEMFTPNPDEGDYRLRCLRWECSENSCTPGKSPTDFLPAAYHQDDAPSGCKCTQTNLGPVFNPPQFDPNTDFPDIYDKYRRSGGQLGRMWRALR